MGVFMADKEKINAEVSYSTQKADSDFLSPKVGGSFSPRQIAVCSQGQNVFLSWVHHKNNRDFLVVSKRTNGCYGNLTVVSQRGETLFSKPTFLHNDADVPDIFCAVAGKKAVYIHRYVQDGRRWICREKITTSCKAIYHIDVVSQTNGRITLAYAGIPKNTLGAQVYTRTSLNNRWGQEQLHKFADGSCNRPKLILDKDGKVIMVADVYHNAKYDIAWKILSNDNTNRWGLIKGFKGWNLFPCVVRDTEGTLWICWLQQKPVRRQDVMGLCQYAQVAYFKKGRWHLTPDINGLYAANLNFGLLPAKRYFGYNGLRRYPRLFPTCDGAVWLGWEQQKDEREIWENVSNGFFCAKIYSNRKWSGEVILTDQGHCHSFDEKDIYQNNRFPLISKSTHRVSGNDFEVRFIDLSNKKLEKWINKNRWQSWKDCKLPAISAQKKKKQKEFIKQDGYYLFWGDLHCHSIFSPDAEGEPDELYNFARDMACLDFSAVTDNDFYPHKVLLNSESWYTKSLADNLTAKDDFLAFAGYEWTFHRPGKDEAKNFNHRIVLFTGRDSEIARRNEQAGVTEKSFQRYVNEHKNFVFPHHAYWDLLDKRKEAVVEVTSAWGTYILDTPTIHDALSKGKKFGFVGNSDSHRFMPGLSGALVGVYAKEFSKSAIIEALNARRCFATTGNRTALAFWVNDSFIGRQGSSRYSNVVRWQVESDHALEKVEIIRNGKVVHKTGKPAGTWADKHAESGSNWYYLRTKERGLHRRYPHNIAPAWGKWAWSSPIWVTN